jgi:hypothetical protein
MFNKHEAVLSAMVVSVLLVASFFAISFVQQALAQGGNMSSSGGGNATSAGSNMSSPSTGTSGGSPATSGGQTTGGGGY